MHFNTLFIDKLIKTYVNTKDTYYNFSKITMTPSDIHKSYCDFDKSTTIPN